MKPNVRIVLRERGKITARRDLHNTWTQYGGQYLAEQVSLASYGPDLPERNARLKYLGFGIGGTGQNQLGMVGSAPWSTVFAAGLDPEATTGNQYSSDRPVEPLVTTLERPVPITAVTGPTPAYSAALDWRLTAFDPTQIRQPFSRPDVTFGQAHDDTYLYTLRFFAQFQQGVGGAYRYIHKPWVPGGFAQMPLSEAGLYLDTATTTVAYEPIVTYVTFDTIQITKDTDLEIEWDIRI